MNQDSSSPPHPVRISKDCPGTCSSALWDVSNLSVTTLGMRRGTQTDRKCMNLCWITTQAWFILRSLGFVLEKVPESKIQVWSSIRIRHDRVRKSAVNWVVHIWWVRLARILHMPRDHNFRVMRDRAQMIFSRRPWRWPMTELRFIGTRRMSPYVRHTVALTKKLILPNCSVGHGSISFSPSWWIFGFASSKE